MQNQSIVPNRVARRRPPTWTIGIVTALVAFVFIHIIRTVDDTDAKRATHWPSESIQRSQLLDAAVEHIESERLGQTRPVVSGTSRGDPVPQPANKVTTPPDGYSFVSFASQMPVHSDSAVESRANLTPLRPDWIDSTESVSALARQAADAGREWTFGWLLLAPSVSPRDIARMLAPIGVEVLGRAGRLVRARLPGETARLRQVASTAGIDGLGATPTALKLPPRFARESQSAPDERRPVFITLMAHDTDAHWRRELERLGAVVGRYDDAIRVYTATADHPTLMRLGAADFVLAVEPVGIVTTAHDTVVPAMGVDALRLYTGSPGEFTGVGGTSVAIGVMDTGLNIRHADIATNRASICGRNFVWLGSSLEDEDLWIDWRGHGTHVTATIAGNGFARAKFAGMAPSVRHIRFAKVLSRIGSGTTDSMLQGMDFLAETSSCGGSAAIMPLVVNMSLGASGSLFEGRGTSARKLDATVWDTRQIYVVAQSNEGSTGFSNYASAKNSLAVGAAFDGGEIAPFSSHGPTGDGRLAPLVVATGVGVCSAKGNGSPAGYECKQGTSMASPTVAGVAALLMDAVPGYQLQPAAVRSRLMASAIRPDAWLEDPAAFPLTNSNGPGFLQSKYGLGKVSARTGILDSGHADGWFGGSATAEVAGGIRVPRHRGSRRSDSTGHRDGLGRTTRRHRGPSRPKQPRSMGGSRRRLHRRAVRRTRLHVANRQRGVGDRSEPRAGHVSRQDRREQHLHVASPGRRRMDGDSRRIHAEPSDSGREPSRGGKRWRADARTGGYGDRRRLRGGGRATAPRVPRRTRRLPGTEYRGGGRSGLGRVGLGWDLSRGR